ncbi:DUF6924 domain-containing protein [Nocardiopsis protaetiae]|uniref:DUF6924 domain-containing protein n=1 Tax=Nocardiopsis protaetiae TaxID=3382270 RepID=UPI00387B3D40
MARPSLPLPPPDDGPRVSGTLLLRTGGDDDTWADVLSRMGPLPGLDAPTVPDAPTAGGPRRRLVTVDDPGWSDATAEEVRAALDRDGVWVPDLVLLVTAETAADPDLRPLLALRPSDGEAFRICPRQAALTHLVLYRPYIDMTLERFEGRGSDGAVPVGAYLETLDPAPRYEPPARPLPALVQGNDGLLVRTDFTDGDAWAALVETVRRPGPEGFGDIIDDYGDHIDFVDDPAFDGASPEQLMAAVLPDPEDSGQPAADVVLVVDAVTLGHPEHPVLVVPLEDHPGCAFRLAAETVGIMVVNLAIANQDLEDYMDDRTRDLVMPR